MGRARRETGTAGTDPRGTVTSKGQRPAQPPLQEEEEQRREDL